jgi:hypothetical protein
MFKSIDDIKNKILTDTSKRLLLASGTPPVNGLVQKLIGLFTKDNSYQSTSTPSTFRSGDVLHAPDLVNIAKDLAYDNETLSEWSNSAEQELTLFKTLSRNHIDNLFYRLNKDTVISPSKQINVNSLVNIDSSRTTADVNINSGKLSDGEATLSLNLRDTFAVDFSIVKTFAEGSSKILRSEAPTFQLFFPGTGGGTFNIVIDTKDNVFNCIQLESIGNALVSVYKVDDITTEVISKKLLQTGELKSANTCYLRFNPTNSNYLLIQISAKHNNSPANGELLAVTVKNLIKFSYSNISQLVTSSLSSNSTEKAILNINSVIPKECYVEAALSFESVDGPYSESVKLTNQTSGDDLVFWNPSVQLNETIVSLLTNVKDRFYKAPQTVNNSSDIELFAGINQWEVSYRKTNYDVLDKSLYVGDLNEWNSSVSTFMESRYSVSGDVSLSSTYSIITGSSVDSGFIFTNNYGYSTDVYSSHIMVAFKDGIKKFLIPGTEYKLSTNIYVTKDTTITIGSTVPGGSVLGGTLPHSLYINNKKSLGVSEADLLNRYDWVNVSTTVHLKAGWNSIDLIVSCPNRSQELSDHGISALRISLNVMDSSIQNLLNISNVYARKNSLKEIDLYTLNFKQPILNKYVYSKQQINSTLSSIVFNNDFGYDSSTVFDGLSKGVACRFLLKEKVYTNFNGLWLRLVMSGDTFNTPEILSIKLNQR